MSDEKITAADLIRKRVGTTKKTNLKKEESLVQIIEDEKKVDIDVEIKRLEAELAQEDDDDEDSSSSDEEDDGDDGDDHIENHQFLMKREKDEISRPNNTRKKKISFGVSTVLNPEAMNMDNVDDDRPTLPSSENVVICVSKCAAEAIRPLPASSLPKCKSKKLKVDFEIDGEQKDESLQKNRKRKRSKDSSSNSKKNHHDSENVTMNDGLRQAVMEVLDGYKARSSERIPFYCRVCAHQSANEEEFTAHKRSEFHKAAVQIERKKTYCKLCRKQLTSIVQMQEHLNSKPHKERLAFVQARQRGERVDFRGGRGPNWHYKQEQGGRGRFGQGGRGSRRNGSRFSERCTPIKDDRNRQWC